MRISDLSSDGALPSSDPNVLVIWRSLMIGASFTGACPSCRDDLHSGLQITADHLGLASVGSARRDLDRFGFAFFIKDIYGLFAAASDIALLPGARAAQASGAARRARPDQRRIPVAAGVRLEPEGSIRAKQHVFPLIRPAVMSAERTVGKGCVSTGKS